MTVLPPDVTFGFVKFRAILAIADTADADRNPDSQGATGTVLFTAKDVTQVAYEAGEPALIGKQEIECPLDANGNLLERVGGQIGVWLITGMWVVTYSITGMTIAPHDILVEATHDLLNPLQLATAVPPGPQATVTEYTSLNNRVSTLESYPKITPSPAASPPANPELNQIWVKY